MELGGGRPGWDPVLVVKLELIRQRFGWSDRDAVNAGHNDLRVKACLGLAVEQDGPSQPTLSRVRQFTQDHGLDELYNQRFVALLQVLELLDTDSPVAVDTVPISGAGQVQDTYNLLAGIIRKGLRHLAQLEQEDWPDTARRLGFERYESRSVKGTAEINWSDELERRQFLQLLVDDARELQRVIAQSVNAAKPGKASKSPEKTSSGSDDDESEPGSGCQLSLSSAISPEESAEPGAETSDDTTAKTEALRKVSAHLDKVIADDVNIVCGVVAGVVQKGGGDRMISSTDPNMRHGRKSSSTVIAGYKTQIVATLVYGWILLVRVIAANRHDGKDLPGLVGQLEDQGLEPRYWVGDQAYGTIENHRVFREMRNQASTDKPELISRNVRPNTERFSRDDFSIDFQEREMRCPAGNTVVYRHASRKGQRACASG